ncbi:MAG: hypothetical protein FWH55_12460 [Oscillospiraceae bacterium]|nr:hypothetical protein [Oscillospiraceae bacterium]
MKNRQSTEKYGVVIAFFQPILYVPYLWFSFVNLMSSASLRELQRSIDPKKTPIRYLIDGLTGLSITVIFMIFLMIAAAKKKVQITPFLVANVFFPCVAMILRFYPFLIYLSLHGELVLWAYILVNETAFYLMNILLIVTSVFYLSINPHKTNME